MATLPPFKPRVEQLLQQSGACWLAITLSRDQDPAAGLVSASTAMNIGGCKWPVTCGRELTWFMESAALSASGTTLSAAESAPSWMACAQCVLQRPQQRWTTTTGLLRACAQGAPSSYKRPCGGGQAKGW